MNRLKLFLASTLALLAMLPIFALIPATTYAADISQGLCSGANFEAGPNATCTVSADDGKNKVQKIVNQVVNVFSWVVGVVSVIMIIYGGFKYITSGGDSNGVTSAKNTILFAIVGLVIVALAQVIVKFVIGTVGEATNPDPTVPQ